MIYKGIGIVSTAIIFVLANWLREYLNRRQRRKNRRWSEKCRNTYKRRFAEGQAEINDWRAEQEKEGKKQKIICKNPELAELLQIM